MTKLDEMKVTTIHTFDEGGCVFEAERLFGEAVEKWLVKFSRDVVPGKHFLRMRVPHVVPLSGGRVAYNRAADLMLLAEHTSTPHAGDKKILDRALFFSCGWTPPKTEAVDGSG